MSAKQQIGFMVLTCLSALLVEPSWGQEPLAGEKPVEILDNDMPLRRLLKERFNTALEEVRAVDKLYRSGVIPLQEMADSLQRMTWAGAELAETSAERIKHLQLGYEQAKVIETIVRDKHEEGREGLHTMLRAKALRLDAEIALVKAQQSAVEGKGGVK